MDGVDHHVDSGSGCAIVSVVFGAVVVIAASQHAENHRRCNSRCLPT